GAPVVPRVVPGPVDVDRDRGLTPRGMLARPRWAALEQSDDAAATRQLAVDDRVGAVAAEDEGIPRGRTAVLDVVPDEGDAAPARAEGIGAVGPQVSLVHAEARVGGRYIDM